MKKEELISCVRKLHFCAGHRVLGHGGKCVTPHGHNYYVHVTAQACKLNDLGMIIDFSVLKERLGAWLETNWDHTFLVYEKDHQVIAGLNLMEPKKPPYICPFNPTAENMASFLLETICPQLFADTGVTITKIVVYETDNCYAEASLF